MEYNPWFVMLLGMSTVFIGLFLLILLTKLMSLILNGGAKAKTASPAVAAAPQNAMQGAVGGAAILPPVTGDRKLFDAVICAAISEYMGNEPGGIRITSVKRLGAPDRGGFTAAVSAAIATAMGEDVNGIRIKSIKKI